MLPPLSAGNHQLGYEFVERQASGVRLSEHFLLDVRGKAGVIFMVQIL